MAMDITLILRTLTVSRTYDKCTQVLISRQAG
jgi:hypothetical protein